MKKFLIICGAIFLIILVIAGAGIGFVAYNGSKLDMSARDYADQNIPPILSSWSPQDLMNLASPELKKITPPDAINALFKKLSQLGELKTYEKAQGNSLMFYTPATGNRVTADLTMHAVFVHGVADLSIKLIQHDNQWQLLGLHVESPIFLK
jgi:hypothetical protein